MQENSNVGKPIVKRRFIKDALVLTMIALLMRVISMIFMVYVSNVVGAEGIGLYQLTYSVYLLFVSFSTSSIGLAVTRIVSEQAAVGNTYGAKSAFRRCMMLCILLSSLAAIILYCFSQPLGMHYLKDVRTILSLRLLSFSLPFLSVGSTIRGYFLGLKKGVKAVSTEIVEMVTQIIITIPLIKVLSHKGIEYSCCALIIGALAAELASCIYASILYLTQKTKMQGDKHKVERLNRKLLSIIVPSSVGYYTRSALQTIENVMMPIGLKKYGNSGSDALSQYGMVKGMTLPLLYFPSAVLSAFSSLLVPEISSENAKGEKRRIGFIINKSFKATLIFSILVTGIFISFSNEIGLLVYKNKEVGRMIFMLAPLVPLMYLDQIVDSVLKGLNQQVSSMKYNTVDSALRALLIFLLVPVIGMKGYIIMLYAGTTFNALLSINRLIVVSKVKFYMVSWVVLPIISITISCILSHVIIKAGGVVQLLFAVFSYFVFLCIFGCITKRDIRWVRNIFS